MLYTAALVMSGMLIISGGQTDMKTNTHSPRVEQNEEKGKLISFDITVNTSDEELAKIEEAALEAGMGFTYKIRGVAKKKLVIDMVIEYGEEFEMKRLTITEADGTQQVEWMANEEGTALRFAKESDASALTKN